MADYQISTSIDANVSKFKNAFNQAKRIVERFKGSAESVKDTDVDADTSSFRAKMKAARRSMDSFSSMKAKSTLDVNSSAASAQIARFKAMLKSIPNRHRTRLEVDGNGARRAISAVHNSIQNFKSSLDSLAGDIRTTGTIFSSMFRGVMLSSVTALVPAIASVVPALMAVLNAAAAVGGGAIGMVGAFATAGAGVVGFGAMAMSALQMVEDGTLAVTSEVQNYQSAVESLKSAWQGLIAQNQSEIFNTLANAVNAAKVALAGLSPFLSGVAQGMEVASAATLDWAKNSQVATNFFDMMGSTGVRIFNNMLSAAGAFGSGLIAVLTNLAPLTEWVSKGFENMGKSFNQWATSVEGSTAIQDFTNFVKTNLPIIGEIFSSTFKGIFNLMKAFAPNSQVVFESLAQMANRFQQWSATIAESDGFQQFIKYVQENGPKLISLIGQIIKVIINIGIALAPLASVVLDVALAFAKWLAKLTETNPLVGILIGVIATLSGIFMALAPSVLAVVKVLKPLVKGFFNVITKVTRTQGVLGLLRGAFTLLGGPIGLVIGIIGTLIGILVALWNESEVVRTAMIDAWNAIKEAVKMAVDAIIQFVTQLINRIKVIIAPLVPIFQQTWNDIVSVVETAINIIRPIVEQAWNTIKAATKIAWELIKMVIKIALEVIASTITAALQLISGDWRGAWQTIKSAGQEIWNAIVTAAKNIFNILKGWLSDLWNSIKQNAVTAWNALKGQASSIWQSIVSGIQSVVQGLVGILSSIWSSIVSTASSMWSSLVGIASSIWGSIVDTISSIVDSIVSFVSSAWSSISSTTSSIFSSIASTISSIWSSIVSAISSFISNIVSTVSSGWNNVMSTISSILSSIASTVSSIWSSIVSSISSFISNIVSTVTSGWNNVLSAITSAMSSIVSSVTSGMSNMVSAVQSGVSNAVSAAKSFVGDMVSAGVDLIQGMINGVKQMAGKLVSAAKGVVGDAVKGAKSLLGIHSPSKVFKEIGQYTMQGMQIGLNDRGKKVVRDTSRIAKQMTQGFNPNLQAKPAVKGINRELNNLSTRGHVTASHSTTVKAEPSTTKLQIQLDTDDEVLTAKVNGVNARDGEVLSFN
ncbi:phage tail protein [Staphylococcus shinii]|uniref:phage tail protein n=1 Tax=Staphylococcus shinii TaxID=2912228 RepID=UPI003D8083D3